MRKKSILKRRRKIKGGESLLDKITGKVEGSLITDNIENAVSLKKKEELISEYKRRKEIAEKQALDTKLAYDEREKNLQLEYDRNLKRNELNFKKNDAAYKNIGSAIKWGSYGAGNLVMFLIKFIADLFITIFKYVAKFIIALSKSNSPIIKTICLIIVIMIILMLIFSALGLAKPANKFDFKKPTSTDIFTDTNMPNMGDYMNMNFTDFSFNNFMSSFSIFKNYFSKMFGNDTIAYSIDNQLRETINVGRWDGIYHVKPNNDDNHVYSIIKPKDITFNVNINNYPGSDYFKLPKVIRNSIFDTTKNITIPNTFNKTGRYSYHFSNAYIDVKENHVKYPLFVDDSENYHIINDVSIDDLIFTDSDNINKDVLVSKMFTYKDNKFVYPMDYINNKIT